jgi:hypothetical protein
VTYHIQDLAVTYWSLGDLVRAPEPPAARLVWYEKSVACLQRWLERDKDNAFASQFFEQCSWKVGLLLLLDGKAEEAVSAWEAASRLAQAYGDKRCQASADLVRIHLQRQPDASERARKLMNDRLSSTEERTCQASLMASLAQYTSRDAQLLPQERARLSDLYAVLSVDLLTKAYTGPALDAAARAAQLTQLKKNPYLDPLRTRADFKELIRKLETAGAAR